MRVLRPAWMLLKSLYGSVPLSPPAPPVHTYKMISGFRAEASVPQTVMSRSRTAKESASPHPAALQVDRYVYTSR